MRDYSHNAKVYTAELECDLSYNPTRSPIVRFYTYLRCGLTYLILSHAKSAGDRVGWVSLQDLEGEASYKEGHPQNGDLGSG